MSRSSEPAFPVPMQFNADGKFVGGGFPGLDVRQFFAAHAPMCAAFFEPVGAPPMPDRPARLVELEQQVRSAAESDQREALTRAAAAGPVVNGQLLIMKPEESLVELLLTTDTRAELLRLQQEYAAAVHARNLAYQRLVCQQWPWFWADLVLAGQKGGRDAA